MANDDAFFFQGLPQSAIPQTLHGYTVTDHQAELADDARLRARDAARSNKLQAEADAARSAAWKGRMAILNE